MRRISRKTVSQCSNMTSFNKLVTTNEKNCYNIITYNIKFKF